MPIVNCPECGNPTSTAARECPACGHPMRSAPGVSLPPSALPYARTRTRAADVLPSGTATAGMICGVGGLILLFVPCVWFIAVLPTVLGIILSSLSFGRIKRGEETGWGMAVAGLLCGIIGTALYGLMWLLFQDAVHEAFSRL